VEVVEIVEVLFYTKGEDKPVEGERIYHQMFCKPLSRLFYRGSKHKDEVGAKMRSDERMGTLWQQSMTLVSPGTGFIIGSSTS
jgi:hypothetical protein